jgi:sugar/nucleoside kinase (ribokinase family)
VKLDPARRTGVTLSLTDGGDRSLLTYMGTIDAVTPELIPEELFRGAGHLHFGSYYLQERMLPYWSSVFRRAREAGLTTSFDVGWDPKETWDRDRLKELLAWTDWFLPSEEEVLNIFEADDVSEIPNRLPDRRGTVIIKRGKVGAMAIDPAGKVTEGGPFSVNPIDTTGAGDSFNAGWIAANLSGRRGIDALTFANACGALSTLGVGGAGTLNREALEKFWPEGFAK